MSTSGLPIRLGHRGPAAVDVLHRLDRAGFGCTSHDTIDADAVTSIREFQRSRGLDQTGEVDRSTWSALAEAAFQLGDRLLYHRVSPMLRGDDVMELQRRIGALGFDAGRVDGIFGPDTAAAVENFQRNAGLPADRIFGPDSLAALTRLGSRADGESVAAVRERDRIRQPRESVEPPFLVLGGFGGIAGLLDTVARRLRFDGHRIELVEHPDAHHHARIANAFDADGYLGFELTEDPGVESCYFATKGFTSEGGRSLAQDLADRLSPLCDDTANIVGKRLPILRETRMSAVLVRLGPASSVVRSSPLVAEAIADAVDHWLEPTDLS